MHVLIAGCGWLGTAVARELLARGDRVTGLCASAAGAARLQALALGDPDTPATHRQATGPGASDTYATRLQATGLGASDTHAARLQATGPGASDTPAAHRQATGPGASDTPPAGQRRRGLEPLAIDLAEPGAAERLPEDLDAILALQSARGPGEPSYRRAYLDANRALLAAARRAKVRAFVYTGSTGIFGQRDGSDVTEATPPAPATAEGRVLLEAETALLASGAPARILRLSGLYGPGRLWLVDGVAQGRIALGPGDGAWLNACHQDDAVAALLAVLDRGRDGAVYHATDACPLRRREAIAFIAERLGIPAPTSLAARDPLAPDRRVLGERTREELGLRLRWPSLREGLAPLLGG